METEKLDVMRNCRSPVMYY